MSKQLFVNHEASTRLAASVTSGATSFDVTAGTGAAYPALSGGDWFTVTLVSADGTTEEIVKVTARATDTFTVTRAQEGTSAAAFASGAFVRPTLTAAALTDFRTDIDAKAPLASPTFTGTPAVPTASAGTNTTQAASTAFVTTAVAKQPEVIVVAVSDETTAITTGTAKVTFRMPFAMTLTAVRASLTTASSSGNPAIDINESGVSILSTTLTIDSGEKTSTTAATPAVISDASLADDAEMTIDVDTAGTGAAGLKVYLIGTRT